MDKLYYQYMEVLLYCGITGFLVKVIIFSSLILYEYNNNINGYIYEIHIYCSETNIFVIIFYQFLYYILYNGIYYLLIILMIFYLKPNHIIITDEIFVYANDSVKWNVKELEKQSYKPLYVYSDFDQMLDSIVGSCNTGSTILVMSNGGFNGIHQKLLKKLNDK